MAHAGDPVERRELVHPAVHAHLRHGHEVAVGPARQLLNDEHGRLLRIGRQRQVPERRDDVRAHPQLVLEHVRPGGPRPQMGTHARDELVESDRLRQEVVGAGGEALDDALVVAGSGHQDHRQGRGLRAAAQLGGELEPAHPGHRRDRTRRRRRIRSPGCAAPRWRISASTTPIAGASERHRDERPDAGVVVDHEDRQRPGVGRRQGWQVQPSI